MVGERQKKGVEERNERIREGGAIGSAGNRQLPTAGTHVRSQVMACGIYCEESDTAKCFLRALPLSNLIPSAALIYFRSWYNRPTTGRRTIRTQELEKDNK